MHCSWCVAVAGCSKALVSFFCVCLRESSEFEPSHGGHQQAILVVDDGFGHSSPWAGEVNGDVRVALLAAISRRV